MALVNFSLPIIPSFVSTQPNKLVDVKLFDGSITQQLLFIPDIKVLLNFANGELGIADSIMKGMILKNLPKVSSPQIAEQFLKSAGAKIQGPIEDLFKDGKISLNPEKISFDKISGNLGGLKSLEKSLIQSIFETQKPYMEIFKLVIQNLVKIEDIIARVLAISGSSMDPKYNPKALGYQGQEGKEFLKKMAELDGLIKADTAPKDLPKEEESTPEEITDNPALKGGSWVTQSIVYSTGEFDPNVNYTYIYEYSNQVEEKIKLDPNGTFSVPEPTNDNHLPKYVIFGVFDSEFNPVQESLITTTLQDARLDGTVSKNINWINRSGKWLGKFEQINESNGDFTFVKDGFGNNVKYGEEGHSIEVGPEGNKEKKYIKKGLPKITGLTNLINYYNEYYLDETKRRAEKKGLSASQIDGVLSEIGNKLATVDDTGTTGIQTTVEAALENGFLNLTNQDNTIGLRPIQNKFINAKFPFKPKKVNFEGQQIWVDPEAKYDMKIIKCDSSRDITFLDIESDNKQFKTTKILRFVKDVLSIVLNDNSDFYYEITNNQNLPISSFGNTAEISIDNTLGGNFGTIFNPPVQGTVNIYSRFMPLQYRAGLIFTSPEDGNNYRLTKFLDTWKVEQIYWSINSVTREGDIISLSVYGNVKKERGLDNIERVRIKFPDNNFYYFTTFDGQFIHKKVYEGNIVTIRPQGVNQRTQTTINVNTGVVSSVSSVIPPNSIRVNDPRYKFGRLISNTQVLNQKLAEKNNPLSRGKYGSPSNGLKQNIEQIYRYQQTEDDTETYYIIEGILSSENKQKLSPTNTQTGGSQTNSRDYTFPDFIGVIPVFIEMLIDVFAKLVPNITSLINLISNPTKFITDIIIAKLGDNNGTEPEKFGIFSKVFLDDLKKLAKISVNSLDVKLSGLTNLKDVTKAAGSNFLNDVLQGAPNLDSLNFSEIQQNLIQKAGNTADSLRNSIMSEQSIEKLELREKLQNFVNNSKLKNYVYITKEGKPKFLMDGTAKINLFGDAPMLKNLPSFTFGLEVNLSSLTLPSFTPPNLNIQETLKNATSNITGISSISKNLGQTVKTALDTVDIKNLSSKVKDTLSSIPLPFKPIFETSMSLPNLTLAELSGLTEKFKQKIPKGLTNFNFEQTLEVPNEIFSKLNDSKFLYQIADIQKNFKSNNTEKDFKYAYVFQDIQKKILKATQLQETGDLNKAAEILEEVQKFLPNDLDLKDSISKIKSLTSQQSIQPVVKFMLNIVTLPLKVIFGIIKYIMDLFKSFLNPFELPFKIVDFVSFKWMLDFFNPTSKNSILSMLGMKFDIETLLTSFVPRLQAANMLSKK